MICRCSYIFNSNDDRFNKVTKDFRLSEYEILRMPEEYLEDYKFFKIGTHFITPVTSNEFLWLKKEENGKFILMGNLKETEVIKLYGVFESLGESLKYEDRLLKNAKVVESIYKRNAKWHQNKATEKQINVLKETRITKVVDIKKLNSFEASCCILYKREAKRVQEAFNYFREQDYFTNQNA